MIDAIFQTTGQALAISFLVMSTPPKQDSCLRKALVRLIENLRNPTAEQLACLAQLRGEPGECTGFDGLTPDEIRAQCAMIVQAVTDHLPGPEREAVIGWYTRDGIRKIAAVEFLSSYLKPGDVTSQQRLLFNYAVWRSLPKHGADTGIPRAVLAGMGVTDKAAAAYVREMRKRLDVLRLMGEGRLQALFLRDGVICEA